MIIPAPKFEAIPLNLAGLSFLQKVKKVCTTPPQFKLSGDWIITLDDGLQLIFPKGFVTDFASVPRLFWLIPGFSPYGPLLYGSIPHDFGYQHGYFLANYADEHKFSKKSISFSNEWEVFAGRVPVFIGRNQEFFDNFMQGIVLEVSNAKLIASVARWVLSKFGHVAWNNYRQRGPQAYGRNSLGLPGLVKDRGVQF